MTDWLNKYEQTRDRLEAENAYDRSAERDACGVGLVCSIDGTPRRDVVDYAIRSLKAVAHRGAVDPDGLSPREALDIIYRLKAAQDGAE